MTVGSPRPQDDSTASRGASEAEAAKPVAFETDPKDGPSPPTGEDAKSEPPDAAEIVGTKRKDGEVDRDRGAPGTVAPEDLSTESDDGAA